MRIDSSHWGILRVTCSVVALAAVLVGGTSMAPGGTSLDPASPRVTRPPAAMEGAREEGATVTGRALPSTRADRARTSSTRGDLALFKGLGAWIDLFDLGLHAGRTTRMLAANGVRTLYLQTGHSYADHAVHPGVGDWLVAAHEAGLDVVGWYLPDYKNQSLDRKRTAYIKRYEYRGHRFDGLGIDIENRRGVRNARIWSKRVAAHAADVRRIVGPEYPVASIPPTPLQMRLIPYHWAGFPWEALAKHTDAFLLMSYWSDRSGCPRIKAHCPYEFTRLNIEITRELTGAPDVLVHIIGGVGDRISSRELRAFVEGAIDGRADGASIYDVATTRSSWWSLLNRRLSSLG